MTSNEQLRKLADELVFWRSHREDDERDAALDMLEGELALLPDEEQAEVLRRAE